MDREAGRARVVAVALRRAAENARREDDRVKWECDRCGERHTNYNSHVEHGLCRKCRNDDFEAMRGSRICCRCGEPAIALTPHSAQPYQAGRFLACTMCGLVIASRADDRVLGVGKERGEK